MLVAVPPPAGSADGPSRLSRGGYETSTTAAAMQTVTVPARVGRLAVQPRTAVVWGLGYSHATVDGWDRQSPQGQVVFVVRRPGAPWQVAGPPLDVSGRPANPTLSAFAIAEGGEGWAVGASAMYRMAPGSDRWIESADARQVAGDAELSSVSLVRDGGAAGYAVGANGVILRYAEGRWERESPAVVANDGNPDLVAVATVSRDEAWAVSGAGSRGLLVYRRTAQGWRSVEPDASPDNAVFGGPHPAKGPNGGVNHAASGASVAADASGAWIGGAMFPGEAVHPTGDEAIGDKSRPFVIRISAGDERPTSYCPDQYALHVESGGNTVDQTKMCDHPFPTSAFDITSIALLPGGEAFAGGLGLFRFKSGGWTREPNANGYLISVAMVSPQEGWTATTGDTFGAGGSITASETTLGHWTTKPDPVRVARWPQPQIQPLLGVAVAPDDSGRALAVGEEGAVVAYEPGVGWDRDVRVTTRSVNAVAWQDSSTAWGVGQHGLIQRYRDGEWTLDPASRVATSSSLFGVAFRDGRGIAVGAGGTILRYDGTRWAKDPASGRVTDADLYGVAIERGAAVAAGRDGTVIRDAAGAWRLDPSVRTMLNREPVGAPALYAVASSADGSFVVGGDRSALLAVDPSGRITPMSPPVEGTILALAVGRSTASGRTIVASVSPDSAKYRGDRMGATRSAVLAYDGRAWRDISMSRLRTIYPSADSAAYGDPVYGVAFDRSGRAGWAVGGFPAETPDDDGHMRLDPTSSVYRFDLDGDPAPSHTRAEIDLPNTGVSFAFFGETWCGQGLCSMTAGTGTHADQVALAIRKEIESLAAQEHGPRFVMFGGNGRAAGIPEELGQEVAFLGRFGLPVYSAPGNRDLFSGFDDTLAGGLLEALGQKSGGSEYWKSEFLDAPAPLGRSRAPAGFVAVDLPGPAADPSRARTHYAFDYQPAGRKLVRVVVIDSSTRSYGQPAEQNPPESQGDWLQAVLTDAKLQNGGAGVPAVIVMNQPTRLPDISPRLNWTRDQLNFESTVVAQGVSAVVTAGIRMNTKDILPGPNAPIRVPLYVAGTGGAPLGYELPDPSAEPPSKLPDDGFYNAWFLVHIDPDKRPNPATPNQATVTVTPFPILESIALHAPDGARQAAGNPLRFSALARGLTGGGSDPEQSRATYYEIGHSTLATCEAPGQGRGICKSLDAITPPYRFYSEDPAIADFVMPDFSSGLHVPDRVHGKLIPDSGGQFGLLCTFRRGTTYVNVVSGMQRARMKVTVDAGDGRCVDEPVPPPPPPPPVIVPEPPAPEPVRDPPPPPRPQPRIDLVALFPPPPAPVVAPAPPGAPGVGRKEEHEVEYETESDEHRFTALDPNERRIDAVARAYRPASPARSIPYDAAQAWALIGFGLAGALALAAAARTAQQRRCTPARAWSRR